MAVNTRKEQHAMWTKDTESFTADELITGTAIAAKIISEGTGLDESAIDAALNKAHEVGISAEEWEVKTRELLGIPPSHERDRPNE